MQPIQEVDPIDIIGKRRDAKVDLIVVTNGRLGGSEDVQRLLLQKLATYVDFAQSSEFSQEFGQHVALTIKLKLEQDPDPIIGTLIEQRIVPWLTDAGLGFEVVHD